MDSLLIPYRSLLTQAEERAVYRALAIAYSFMLLTAIFAVAAVLALGGVVVGGVPTLAAILLALASGSCGLAAFRSGNRKDILQELLLLRLQERLSDELFLRYHVVPLQPLALSMAQAFGTEGGDEVWGRVTLLLSGEPEFAVVQRRPLGPFAEG
jgi:hypothetical protein